MKNIKRNSEELKSYGFVNYSSSQWVLDVDSVAKIWLNTEYDEITIRDIYKHSGNYVDFLKDESNLSSGRMKHYYESMFNKKTGEFKKLDDKLKKEKRDHMMAETSEIWYEKYKDWKQLITDVRTAKEFIKIYDWLTKKNK